MRRFTFMSLLFCFLFSSTFALAEDVSFITKIKRFFLKEKTPVEAQVETPVQGSADAPFQAEEKPSEDRFAPTFDFSEKIIGNPDAPVKVYIFTSLTCGHCSTLHNNYLPKIVEKYVDTGEIYISLVDFPLEGRAMIGSLISKCLSGERYFAFMDTLYAHQRRWMGAPNLTQALAPYARLAGLPEQKMIACAEDKDAEKEISRQRNLYVAKYRIRATPTLVVTHKNKSRHLEGVPSMESFDAAVNEVLGKKE